MHRPYRSKSFARQNSRKSKQLHAQQKRAASATRTESKAKGHRLLWYVLASANRLVGVAVPPVRFGLAGGPAAEAAEDVTCKRQQTEMKSRNESRCRKRTHITRQGNTNRTGTEQTRQAESSRQQHNSNLARQKAHCLSGGR